MKRGGSKPAARLRVVHMASCARSGETLLLRMLDAHPGVHVAFDLEARNSEQQNAARRLFMRPDTKPEVSRDHSVFAGLVSDDAEVVLVKQGVWEHAVPFNGFVLARNPVSVIASLLAYDHSVAFWRGLIDRLKIARHRWQRGQVADPRWERLLRWQDAIDPALTPHLRRVSYIDALCAFYVRRMLPLTQLGLPIVAYERLATEPAEELRFVLSALGLPMVEEVLNSHRSYKPGALGHGKNDLSQPVSASSLSAFRDIIDRRTFDRIAALTYPAWSALGYTMSWQSIKPPNRSADIKLIG